MKNLSFDDTLRMIEEILELSTNDPTSCFVEFFCGDDDYHIISDCSTEFCFWLGYKRGEVIGRSSFELTPKEFHEDLNWTKWGQDINLINNLPDRLFFKYWLRSDGTQVAGANIISSPIPYTINRRIIKIIPVKELPVRNPPIQPYEWRWLRKRNLSLISTEKGNLGCSVTGEFDPLPLLSSEQVY